MIYKFTALLSELWEIVLICSQAILTVAISRKLFNSHKRRSEFMLAVNQVRRMTIAKDGRESEIRAYSGNPDVRILFLLFFFVF